MNGRRVWTLARRVMRQVWRDRRVMALLILGPILVLSLGAVLFRTEAAPIPLGIVNQDEGVSIPFSERISMAERVVDELAASDSFELVRLQRAEIEDRLRDGTVQGVVVFSSTFSAEFRATQQAVLDLRLEGANPTRSMLIQARVGEAAIKALARLASSLGLGEDVPTMGDENPTLPIVVEPSYLFAGEEFDTLDFVAPVYIAFLALFFVFLLTCVSFLRERTQGTMERLLATPSNRLEIVLGYMAGLGIFALLQVAVILLFTIWVIKIHYLGSLALLFLTIALMAIVGVSMGILASAFARNEFQVVQFIPLLIIPQALLSGIFWAVEEMPLYLRLPAYGMPLTYVNRALRNIMLKGWGIGQIWPDLIALSGFALVLIALGALTMRREVG